MQSSTRAWFRGAAGYRGPAGAIRPAHASGEETGRPDRRNARASQTSRIANGRVEEAARAAEVTAPSAAERVYAEDRRHRRGSATKLQASCVEAAAKLVTVCRGSEKPAHQAYPIDTRMYRWS